MIGEIGGPQEVAAGEFAKDNMKKPVIAYIAGLTAPKGRVMGHAGAIVSAYGESAVEKVEILKEYVDKGFRQYQKNHDDSEFFLFRKLYHINLKGKCMMESIP